MTLPIERSAIAQDRGPVQISRALRRFVNEGLAIQFEDARSAGSLGFLTRLTALTNLPYRQIADSRFTRHNGPYVLHIQAIPDIGLPYGRYPRLLLAWITTEVVRTRSRYLGLAPIRWTVYGFRSGTSGLCFLGGRGGAVSALEEGR